MKKRLLITSIVMMLVVAVALSTATYAWFTQNAVVEASSVTMTAGVADAQSISIGWFGSELKSTSLTSATDSAALQPMAPLASFTLNTTNAAAYDETDNANGIAFSGAYVDTTGLFAADGSPETPYTWNNTTTQAFYINNDSNSQPVSIKVAVKNITNGAAIDALTGTTLLEGSGKVYYKKIGTNGAYEKLVKNTDYVPNTDTVADAKTKIVTAYNATSPETEITTSDVEIYATKGIEDYVRIAVFATSNYANAAAYSTLDPEDFTYKGLLSKNGGTNDTVYGEIESGHAASSLSTMSSVTNNVTVISNLPALNRVYVIVKVWLDGADFTQHENNQTANVSLEFSAA